MSRFCAQTIFDTKKYYSTYEIHMFYIVCSGYVNISQLCSTTVLLQYNIITFLFFKFQTNPILQRYILVQDVKRAKFYSSQFFQCIQYPKFTLLVNIVCIGKQRLLERYRGKFLLVVLRSDSVYNNIDPQCLMDFSVLGYKTIKRLFSARSTLLLQLTFIWQTRVFTSMGLLTRVMFSSY